jgi:hypothetical protein
MSALLSMCKPRGERRFITLKYLLYIFLLMVALKARYCTSSA